MGQHVPRTTESRASEKLLIWSKGSRADAQGAKEGMPRPDKFARRRCSTLMTSESCLNHLLTTDVA
eukprot:49783-Eustigmatos_ZCMA.PRE.1